ncbi:MAG: hypothetical protein PHG47_01345 [Sulfuricella sp.]|nr:hypothetical protein [Sulfuricella sp.]
MLEHKRQPIAPLNVFFWRLAKNASLALIAVAAALSIGIYGYYVTEHLPLIDALLNAAMILGGMGPVNELHTNAGKLFAAGYALFSGLVFMIVAGILFAPILHRFLHRLHLETDERK